MGGEGPGRVPTLPHEALEEETERLGSRVVPQTPVREGLSKPEGPHRGGGCAWGLGSVSSLVESECDVSHMCRAPAASGSREVGWKLVPRISQNLSQMLTG